MVVKITSPYALLYVERDGAEGKKIRYLLDFL
jgi:hypothetical protein